jgi:hypothetical protein|tara:strand:+ start:530 stop:661 length:132 start_codon:yes stop_codon:yes gene_type:complete
VVLVLLQVVQELLVTTHLIIKVVVEVAEATMVLIMLEEMVVLV